MGLRKADLSSYLNQISIVTRSILIHWQHGHSTVSIYFECMYKYTAQLYAFMQIRGDLNLY